MCDDTLQNHKMLSWRVLAYVYEIIVRFVRVSFPISFNPEDLFVQYLPWSGNRLQLSTQQDAEQNLGRNKETIQSRFLTKLSNSRA